VIRSGIYAIGSWTKYLIEPIRARYLRDSQEAGTSSALRRRISPGPSASHLCKLAGETDAVVQQRRRGYFSAAKLDIAEDRLEQAVIDIAAWLSEANALPIFSSQRGAC
jgi:hypothetical protein